MEGLMEKQQRKMMVMTSVVDAKEGNFVVEKLRELLLDLGSILGPLLEKFDQTFPPEARSYSATKPHDPDWFIPLSVVFLCTLTLVGIFLYVFFRCGSCKVGGGGGGETTHKKTATTTKAPQWKAWMTMFEHECLVASLTMVLFIVLSLGGLYYYFCFKSACFGGGRGGGGAMMKATGRKIRMMTMKM